MPNGLHVYELVIFDPENLETYPSVCNVASDVKSRFGFEGGEVLLFDMNGNYCGQVVKRLEVPDAE